MKTLKFKHGKWLVLEPNVDYLTFDTEEEAMDYMYPVDALDSAKEEEDFDFFEDDEPIY